MPMARMLITVPPMIWSTLKVMDSTACSKANKPPASIAATTPAIRLWRSETSERWYSCKWQPASQRTPPASIMPSMPMLTTPARSQNNARERAQRQRRGHGNGGRQHAGDDDDGRSSAMSQPARPCRTGRAITNTMIDKTSPIHAFS